MLLGLRISEFRVQGLELGLYRVEGLGLRV